MSRIRLYITILFAYTTLAGLVTFSLFICQEASQTAMFGTWPAKEVRQWDMVLTGLAVMEKTNKTEKIINWSLGWIQPLAFFSYRSHIKSVEYYIKATRTEVFVHAPELLIGEHVEFYFKPQKITRLENGKYMAMSSKIGVYVDASQKIEMMNVQGVVERQKNILVIKQE